MAVNNQQQRVGSDASALTAARGRRFYYGVNVAVMVALTACLVIVINWIASVQYKRYDVANSGLYGLSDRTKKIVAELPVKDITLTSIYTSNEKGKDRDTYLPRVRDLFDELEAQGKGIKTQNLADDEAKRKLIESVQGKYSGQGSQHKEAIELARTKWGELSEKLHADSEQFKKLTGKGSWLGGFSPFATTLRDIKTDLEEIQQAQQEVDNLVGSTMALPRYDEAGKKIKEANEKVKGHLEGAKKWLAELDNATAGLRDSKSDFAQKTLAGLEKINKESDELKKIIGNPDDTSVPEDPKPVLQAYTKQVGRLTAALSEETNRVKEFVDKNPAIRGYYLWTVQVNPLVRIELLQILAMSRQTLMQVDQQIRMVLSGDQPKDVLQNAIRQLRELSGEVTQNLSAWDETIRKLLAEFGKIDDASRAVLEQAKNGKLFEAELAAIQEVEAKFSSLPEMKTEDIATKFEQDNLVVIETPDQVKVIDFDTMWPKAEAMPGASMNEDDADRRVFNGDAAVAAALLTLGHKNPFATVILTAFEQQPPEGQQRMMPPRTGPIPLAQLSKLRERLEQANFKVKDWNLTTGEPAPAPEPDTKAIYVFLTPPGATPNNPFEQPNPNEKKFGEAEIEQVRKVLTQENARGVFLASYLWPQRSFFQPLPTSYAYDKYLKEEWGVEVQFGNRVIRGIPAKNKPDVRAYEVSVVRWNWMRLNSFNSDNPIGAPLRSRRVLMTDVCPVQPVAKDKKPEGVDTNWVLAVPGSTGRSEFWADSDIVSLISQIQGPKSDGTVLKSDKAMEPPFSVILTSENEKTKSKIVVYGTSMSLIDEYMDRRVPRLGEEGKISFDPPPRENGDLFINSVYWLADKPDLIGAGPVIAPPIEAISSKGRVVLKVLAFGWPLVVLVAGGFMMLVRRK